MEPDFHSVTRLLVGLPPSLAPRNDVTALVTAFARMDRDQAAELLRFAAATGQGSPRTDEETLAQKYRQLDRRGQAAVMETLQREYDYLFKPIEVPVAAMGGGKQKLVTTQADEDRLQRKLAETSPPDDL